jgi:hypothetical protein
LAEEDELMGRHRSREGMGQEQGEQLTTTLTVDEQLAGVLDGMQLYLRIVHSVDLYNLTEYSREDEMPNRCGILHVRDRLVSREPAASHGQLGGE